MRLSTCLPSSRSSLMSLACSPWALMAREISWYRASLKGKWPTLCNGTRLGKCSWWLSLRILPSMTTRGPSYHWTWSSICNWSTNWMMTTLTGPSMTKTSGCLSSITKSPSVQLTMIWNQGLSRGQTTWPDGNQSIKNLNVLHSQSKTHWLWRPRAACPFPWCCWAIVSCFFITAMLWGYVPVHSLVSLVQPAAFSLRMPQSSAERWATKSGAAHVFCYFGFIPATLSGSIWAIHTAIFQPRSAKRTDTALPARPQGQAALSMTPQISASEQLAGGACPGGQWQGPGLECSACPQPCKNSQSCSMSAILWKLSGFSTGYNGSYENVYVKNLTSAINRPHVVRELLNKEINKGRIVGTYPVPPFELQRINVMGFVSKKQPNEYGMIVDLSQPEGNSVNSHIENKDAQVQYPSVQDAVDVILALHEHGLSPFLAKVDIKSAFRLLPMAQSHFPLMGLKFDEKYYIDLFLPMGAVEFFKSFQMQWRI